ncbi:MAG: alpha-glucan phosphorylase [Peptococcaceae bacterium BRH_c8a]|nr:MAG: alpha-glucan phosphorylase [Peptococcaceae bacterium BRH_c8a]
MYPYRTISVIPRLPDPIKRLRELAFNLWFSWEDSALELFRSINPTLWENVYHNPVLFLLQVREEDLNEAASNRSFLERYASVVNDFDRYMQDETWCGTQPKKEGEHLIAYFSAEFGLHESYPIYSGGLGLLAGDHCKAASDLGLPFVGVGLLYKFGYFTQLINREGRQEEHYPYHNFREMPVTPVLDKDGKDVIITVELPGRHVCARVWRMNVGRCSIIFLDADLAVNNRDDRTLTAQLYGGNQDTRISQEILLGIGGVRALRAMGLQPTVWHINEGHAAFLLVERMREMIEEQGMPAGPVMELLRADTIFTTHTPVPAGHDVFSPEMIDLYLGHYYGRLGLSREQFYELGHDHGRHGFNMTMLALGRSGFCNGVSRLHGQVTRAMFHHLYKGLPEEEVPIGHVTNGVHTLTWLAPGVRELFDGYLEQGWDTRVSDPDCWKGVDSIPDQELWTMHSLQKEKALDFARKKLVEQRMRNRETMDRISEVDDYLRPQVLTIGFSRRFATYKRADLLFRDLARLNDLVNNPRQPVQFVFAGKAHPADVPGHDLIKLINEVSKEERFRGKVVFLENYDINVSRYLLQGVDVWLNTPRRPFEASGTSGMKAAINGVLNCSVLDGWWPEAFNGANGFMVGTDWDFSDEETQDRYDFNALYTLLEEDVVPAYYEREDDIPKHWVKWMKESIKSIAPYFSTERMVMEYAKKYYFPAMERHTVFYADGYRVGSELYALKKFLQENWHHIKVLSVKTDGAKNIHPDEKMLIGVEVELGPVKPEQVRVEIAYGEVWEKGLRDIQTTPLMLEEGAGDDGRSVYKGEICLPQGMFGYTVRVRPHSPHFAGRFELPLVAWSPPF